MSTFAVQYTYAPEPERLDEHRPEHREFLRSLHADGHLALSGPLGGDPAGGLLIMNGEDAGAVLGLLNDDPFRREGLIADCVVRAWDVVIGELRA